MDNVKEKLIICLQELEQVDRYQIAKKLKEKSSNCKIVGCDPIGSLYADPSRPDKVDMTFQVEGVGYNFIPKTLEHSLIDSWE